MQHVPVLVNPVQKDNVKIAHVNHAIVQIVIVNTQKFVWKSGISSEKPDTTA